MIVKVVNKSTNALPKYQTALSAGVDLCAYIPNGPVELKPLQRQLVPTGLFIELPVGYEAQIRPRSGLSLKHGITVLNSPGTIDADYRGELCVVLVNISDQPFVVNNGDRIAQMVVAKCEQAELVEVDELTDTERGANGFGSTGK